MAPARTTTIGIASEAYVSDIFLVNIHGETGKYRGQSVRFDNYTDPKILRVAPVEVSCHWKLCPSSPSKEGPQHFRCLDLFLSVSSTACDDGDIDNYTENPSLPHITDTALGALVRASCMGRVFDGKIEVTAKVIIVPQDGFLCRSDILQLRMKHCELVDSIVPFLTPRGNFRKVNSKDHGDLLELMLSSPGALLLKPSSQPHQLALELLEKDIRDRLSFDWVLPNMPTTRSVAVVGGRPMFDVERQSYGSQGPFDAAGALNISVIVLDRPGHFMEGAAYAHLRDDFIAIDMNNEAELPNNIVGALKGRKIDGIITFSDEYVISTARAAELLNLPTEPVASILAAHYKDETRKILNCSKTQALRLENATQLEDPFMREKLNALKYPLVVKPCRGGASRGVKRARDLSSLHQAVLQMEKDGLAKHGILIETYVDGPEVDANIALWDGQLLFAEITDDFPCQADAADATISDTFGETIMLSPSCLSTKEQKAIASSLHKDLIQMGFRHGVFHVEARVQNSSMSYQNIDGIKDLADTCEDAQGSPDVFLIEVNARPPGLDCAFSTLYTFGVDLCGLQLLQCLNDGGRFAALCKPFSSVTQYWCGNCLIPMHRENILVPDDFCGKVLERLPEIAPFVSRAELFRQPGTVVTPRLGVEFLAYFLLYSRTSRRHVLQMYDEVMETCRIVLDEV